MYAADEYVNRLEDIYFPILKIIRADEENHDVDYTTGQTVRIYRDGELLGEVSNDEVVRNAETLFERIFKGAEDEKGAFEIPEIDDFLGNMKITQIKAPAGDKVGLSLKSVGSGLPTYAKNVQCKCFFPCIGQGNAEERPERFMGVLRRGDAITHRLSFVVIRCRQYRSLRKTKAINLGVWGSAPV